MFLMKRILHWWVPSASRGFELWIFVLFLGFDTGAAWRACGQVWLRDRNRLADYLRWPRSCRSKRACVCVCVGDDAASLSRRWLRPTREARSVSTRSSVPYDALPRTVAEAKTEVETHTPTHQHTHTRARKSERDNAEWSADGHVVLFRVVVVVVGLVVVVGRPRRCSRNPRRPRRRRGRRARRRRRRRRPRGGRLGQRRRTCRPAGGHRRRTARRPGSPRPVYCRLPFSDSRVTHQFSNVLHCVRWNYHGISRSLVNSKEPKRDVASHEKN